MARWRSAAHMVLEKWYHSVNHTRPIVAKQRNQLMLDPTPYRRLFPLTDRFVFLNHAGVSPLNTRAVEAMHAFIERTMTEPFTHTYDDALATLLDLRQRIATLINACSVDEI